MNGHIRVYLSINHRQAAFIIYSFHSIHTHSVFMSTICSRTRISQSFNAFSVREIENTRVYILSSSAQKQFRQTFACVGSVFGKGINRYFSSLNGTWSRPPFQRCNQWCTSPGCTGNIMLAGSLDQEMIG
jgi:hypothetical protein